MYKSSNYVSEITHVYNPKPKKIQAAKCMKKYQNSKYLKYGEAR